MLLEDAVCGIDPAEVKVRLDTLRRRGRKDNDSFGYYDLNVGIRVRFLPVRFCPIESRSAIISEGSCSVAALRFSRRCSTEDVPGISRMLGERCRSHASATCMGVACNDAAAASSADDCNGVNPPSGKNGT